MPGDARRSDDRGRAGDHAHRQGRGVGSHRRAGARRRRLHHQALQPGRGRGPRAGAAAPGTAPRTDQRHAHLWPAQRRRRSARRQGRRPGRAAHRQGVPAAPIPAPAPRPGAVARPAALRRVGLRLHRRHADGGRPRAAPAREAALPGRRARHRQAVRLQAARPGAGRHARGRRGPDRRGAAVRLDYRGSILVTAIGATRGGAGSSCAITAGGQRWQRWAWPPALGVLVGGRRLVGAGRAPSRPGPRDRRRRPPLRAAATCRGPAPTTATTTSGAAARALDARGARAGPPGRHAVARSGPHGGDPRAAWSKACWWSTRPASCRW